MKSLNVIDEGVSEVVNMSEIQLLFVQELFPSFRIHFNCTILMSAQKMEKTTLTPNSRSAIMLVKSVSVSLKRGLL